MLDVRFRHLPTWTGKQTTSRRNLPGEQTYSQILDRLESELSHLSAREIIIETGHRSEDIRNDGWVRSNARVPSHPGVALYFDSKAVRAGHTIGELRYACDRYTTWQDNLRAIVLTLEDLRKIEGRGATESGQQYRGYTALPAAPTAQPDDPEKAARFLMGIAETRFMPVNEVMTNRESARSVYKEAAKKTHPDTGGNAIAFQAVQQAWNTLLEAQHNG